MNSQNSKKYIECLSECKNILIQELNTINESIMHVNALIVYYGMNYRTNYMSVNLNNGIYNIFTYYTYNHITGIF